MERWVEIDIDWFGSPPWDERIGEFVTLARRARREGRLGARA